MAEQALSGIRVLDLTHHIAGPYATKLLADFGAEVIKVERPGVGDPARRMGPFFQDDPHPEKSGLFLHLNTNKKGITLNLKSRAGVRLFLELAREADAVVESFRPGVMGRLGLGWEVLGRVNPRLVLTSLTSFGQTGPYRDFKATELVSLALGSPMYRMGEPDREPVKFAGNSGQYLAGTYAAVATLGALYGARLRGRGGPVDVSIMECFLNMAGRYLLAYIYSGEVPRRFGYRREGMYPHGYFPARDGYVGISAAYLRSWPRVVRLLGMPELLEDPRFQTPEARMQHHDDFDALFYPWLLERSRQEIFHTCQEYRCPAGPVYNTAELLQDPHYRERGFFVDIEHPVTGRATYPGAPFKMARTPWRAGRAPLLGEHNQEVYGERMGYSREDPGEAKGKGGDLRGPLPLEGIRVLDLGDVLAGPMAALFLGDLGAEVIAVEAIQRLGQRGPIRPLPGSESYPNKEPGERPWNRNSRFDETARNKLSVTLDLTRPRGKELFLGLVRVSDVFISNFLPRVMESLGLTYPVLREARPDLIALYMPAYGLSGPYKNYTGIGPSMEAISGATSLRGYLGSDPSLNTVHWATDVSACVTGSFAVLAALHHRLQTGHGQVIDLSQIETLMPHLGEAILDYTMNGRIQGPMGNRHPSCAPQGLYRCRGENRWVAITVTSDEEWEALCRVLGDPPWCREERFADPLRRWQNQDELDRRLEEWTSGQDHYQVMHRLQQAGVPAGAVLDEAEICQDPHLRARGFFQEITHPEAGTYGYPGAPWRLGREPLKIRRRPPCLGEHNQLILGGLLGLSQDELVRLEAEKIIGTVPLEGSDAS